MRIDFRPYTLILYESSLEKSNHLANVTKHNCFIIVPLEEVPTCPLEY